MKNFVRDERGNVAMMYGVGLIAILAGVGAAADYGAASKRQRTLQGFTDAAVLAAAKSRSEDVDELQKIVDDTIALHNTEKWPVKATVKIEDDNIYLTTESDYDTILLGIIGTKSMPFSATTASPRARLTPINLALVLDTTDSMEGENLAAMKGAALALIDDLEDQEAATRVSVVPFGQYVNIGKHRGVDDDGNVRAEAWLDMGDYGKEYEHCWTKREWITEPTCTVTGTETYTIWRDGQNMGTGTRDTQTCSGGVQGPEEEVCQTRTYDWHGCAGSRAGGQGYKVDYTGTRIPAALDEWCGTEMMTLSQNWGDMRSKIGELTTNGGTYLPSGLMWGWRTLDPRQPLTEAAASPADRKDAILFMTDGANTISRGERNGNESPRHKNWTGAKGLDLTKKLCSEIKKANIEIFTVAYKLDDLEETAQSLRECASSPSHAFTPDNAAELNKTFKDIGTLLDRTRIIF